MGGCELTGFVIVRFRRHAEGPCGLLHSKPLSSSCTSSSSCSPPPGNNREGAGLQEGRHREAGLLPRRLCYRLVVLSAKRGGVWASPRWFACALRVFDRKYSLSFSSSPPPAPPPPPPPRWMRALLVLTFCINSTRPGGVVGASLYAELERW